MPSELRENVWWLDLAGVNAFLVDDDGALTLVDAGPPWQPGGVLDAVVELDYALTDLDRVLITHYDADHVAGLSRLGGLDVTVYVGAGDADIVAGERSPNWRTKKGALQRLLYTFVGDSTVEVNSAADGDTVGSFTVYETPGHTPGHVAYVSESLETAFLGDLVLESGGRLELPPRVLTADVARARESLRSLADRTPEFEVAGMGHGVPFVRDGKQRLADLVTQL